LAIGLACKVQQLKRRLTSVSFFPLLQQIRHEFFQKITLNAVATTKDEFIAKWEARGTNVTSRDYPHRKKMALEAVSSYAAALMALQYRCGMDLHLPE